MIHCRRGSTELMASLVVAVVAVVGLVVVYSGFGGSLAGAAQISNPEADNAAANLCGSCLQADLTGQPLPAECSQDTAEGQLYQIGESKAKSYCCRRACPLLGGGEKCYNRCASGASSLGRYAGGP